VADLSVPSFEKFEDLQDLHLVQTNDSAPSSARTAAEKLVGTIIEQRYQLLNLIGEGGMGFVFKAKQLTTGRMVAIKMIASENVSTEQLMRFCQEAKAACAFSHPNAVAIYELFVSDGTTPYLAMQYVEGITLSEEIERNGPLAEEAAARIFSQVADALAHAHQSHVLHRDIKPSNIMLVNDIRGNRSAMLLDFGIAKLGSPDDKSLHLTKTGEVVGTPYYMSPEQCQGKDADQRSDIYALGCVMYEALTGEKAVAGENFLQVLSNQVHAKIKPISEHAAGKNVSPRMKQIIHKAIEKDPNQRFQSMSQLWQVLSGKVESPTRKLVVGGQNKRQVSKQITPKVLTAAAIVTLFALSLVAYMLTQRSGSTTTNTGKPIAQPLVLSNEVQDKYIHAVTDLRNANVEKSTPALKQVIGAIIAKVAPGAANGQISDIVLEKLIKIVPGHSTYDDFWCLGSAFQSAGQDRDLTEKVVLSTAAVAAFDTGLARKPLNSQLKHDRAVAYSGLAADQHNNGDQQKALLDYWTAIEYAHGEIDRQKAVGGKATDLYVQIADAYIQVAEIEKNTDPAKVRDDFIEAEKWYSLAEPSIEEEQPSWADDGNFYLKHAQVLDALGDKDKAALKKAQAATYNAKHKK
jgi:serine/threonine protein kinase